jgi:clan AA aspartic protease (TIGR02281 family)
LTSSRAQQESFRRNAVKLASQFVQNITRLNDFQQYLDKRRAESDPEDETVQLFLGTLTQNLKDLRARFGPEFEYRAPKEYTQLHALVDVSLNGKETVPMIVDSGASAVVISRTVAEKMGLDLRNAETSLTQVADGRYVRSLEVFFDTVEVNGHQAKNVRGFVLDTASPSDQGLLGMTFLTRFNWRIDPTNSVFHIEGEAVVRGR